MYKKLSRYCFIAFALVAVLLLSACSEKTVSGKYISMWDGELYYDFHDGNYTTDSPYNFGTYVVNKNSVVLTPDDNTIDTEEYNFSDEYLLLRNFSGTIPDEEFFNAFCEWEDFDFDEKIQFYSDGTFSRGFTAVGVKLEDMNGTYERKDEVVTLILDTGVRYNLLILDSTLYAAYKKG